MITAQVQDPCQASQPCGWRAVGKGRCMACFGDPACCQPPVHLRITQDAVDPAYGNEELAALRKEVQRLTHTAGELARGQEALVQARQGWLGRRGASRR